MELHVLASGSRGNALLVRGERGALLVDAGISCRRLVAGLVERGQDPARLDAVLLTHEHSDHVAGLPIFLRRYPKPLVASPGTLAALAGALPPETETLALPAGGALEIAGLLARSFRVPHDAAEPFGWVFSEGSRRLGVATDLGEVTPAVEAALEGADALVFESNHDEEMLARGPYPAFTKARVRSRLGHLSNEHAADALARLAGASTRHVVLAHLSETNNDARLALETAARGLARAGARTALHVAAQRAPSASLRL